MITILSAATEPGFTTAINMASQIAIPVVLLIAAGQIASGAFAGRLTVGGFAGTTAICGVIIGMLWMLPTLITSAKKHGPTAETDTSPTTSLPPATPTLSATPTAPPAAQPDQPTDWTWVLQALVALVILAAIVGIGLAAWSVLSRRRASRRAAAEVRRTQLQRWANGVTALDVTSAHLMEFESDVEAVYFTRPLLADVDEPATATFYTAFAEANALHTEAVPTNDEQINAFVIAAAAAARAFGLADENARRKGRLGVIHGGRALTGDEKRKLGQARKLMAQALDPANTPDFAQTAQAKAQAVLDEVGLVIPERLTAEVTRSIEALHMPALSAGTSVAVLDCRRLIKSPTDPRSTDCEEESIR